MTNEERISTLENQFDDMSNALTNALNLIETHATHINELYKYITNQSKSITSLTNTVTDILEKDL